MPIRYQDPPEVSAEFLRLALPLIAEHGMPCDPVNYAVCYEYVADRCSQLKAEIDSLVERGQELTSDVCSMLYRKYVGDHDPETLEELRRGLGRVLNEVGESVSETGDKVHQFGDSLRQYGDSLDDADSPQRLEEIVQGILGETRIMQLANNKLRERLKDSAQRVDELQQQLERARQEAFRDPLTGLANRSAFDQALEESMADAYEARNPLCLVLLDIDHFKKFNDNYGHLLGDKVLRMVAAVLRRSIKGKDTACRYGGEEFAVILPNTPLQGARTLAEQIRGAVQSGRIRRIDSDETVGRVTLSAGLARYRLEEPSQDFVNRADAALYASKHAGRNRVTTESELKDA